MSMATEDIEDMTKEVDDDLSDFEEESSDDNKPQIRNDSDSDSDKVYGRKY